MNANYWKPHLPLLAFLFALAVLNPNAHCDQNAANPLLQAVRAGKVDRVQELLKAGANPLVPAGGILPLNLAASQGNLEIVKTLLANGADNVNDALLASAAGGHLECVRYLVQIGADVNYMSKDDGYTPLGAGAMSGKLPMVDFLLKKGASWKTVDKAGATPLMASVIGRSVDVMKALIDSGSDINARDINGYSVLAATVEYDQLDMAKMLLECGANPNTLNDEKKSPLDEARLKKNPRMIDLLEKATTKLGIAKPAAMSLKRLEALYTSIIVVDARTTLSYGSGHIPGSLSIPNDTFQNAYSENSKRLEESHDQAITVYCSSPSCKDADEVCEKLIFLGFTNVSLFKGGWRAWKQAGLPEEK